MSRATFPPITPNVKKLFADDYKTWWSKPHGNFLDGYLQNLVDAAGPISTKILEVAHQECSNVVPQTRNSFTPMGGKGSFPLNVDAHVSKKRSSQGESNSSHEDRCWKNQMVAEHYHEKGRKKVGKLSGSDVDCSSSFKEEVQVILDEMDGKDVDVSLWMKLLNWERLSNAMLEEHKKIEKVSSIRQSLSEIKEKIEKLRRKEKDLEILLEATEKEVEEAKLGVSTTEKDFDACNDADLLNSDD
ncbi:hypothetical protein HAX54_021497 [Datura stramonium]|uniref:Uncharacterized protein n=1 Tax=Datura stramonium TaxID=4076 RepID=A0ABS8UT08_DATST|nr:hypothetical protein [Datura stramonium]